MAAEMDLHGHERAADWQQPESFARAVKQIAVIAVVLAGGLVYYWHRVETGKKVRAAAKLAKESLLKDTPKAFAHAEAKFKEVLGLDSDFPFALASLGEMHAVRHLEHALPGALEEARRYVAHAEKEDPRIQERYAARGLLMIADGQTAEAEKYLAGIINQGGNGAHLWNTLARAQRHQGKLEDALKHFKKGHDMEWRNPRFAADYAQSFFDAGDMLNAISYFAKGIEANSEHWRSLIGRSRVQIARGAQIKEATDTLNDVLSQPDSDLSPSLRAQALTARGELRRFEKKPDEAEKDADAALVAAPTNPWAHHLRGLVLAQQKKPGAADALQKAVELDPRAPVLYFAGANALAEAAQSDKAIALMEAFARSLTIDDLYHLVYGDVLRKCQKLDDALVQYNKAIDLNPLNATAHFSKGRLLIDKKDYENAKTELEAAVTSNEYFGEAYEALGLLNLEKREYGPAAEKYYQALLIYAQLQMPRERLNALLEDVAAKLRKAGQRAIAGEWMKAGKAVIR